MPLLLDSPSSHDSTSSAFSDTEGVEADRLEHGDRIEQHDAHTRGYVRCSGKLPSRSPENHHTKEYLHDNEQRIDTRRYDKSTEIATPAQNHDPLCENHQSNDVGKRSVQEMNDNLRVMQKMGAGEEC
jgi:hypothetical protein